MDNPVTVQIETVLKRGCFILRVPDRCFEAEDKLTYCWCMWNDFCNHSNQQHDGTFLMLVLLSIKLPLLKSVFLHIVM